MRDQTGFLHGEGDDKVGGVSILSTKRNAGSLYGSYCKYSRPKIFQIDTWTNYSGINFKQWEQCT